MEKQKHPNDTEFDHGTAIIVKGYCPACQNRQQSVSVFPLRKPAVTRCSCCNRRMSRVSIEKSTVAAIKERERQHMKLPKSQEKAV